MPAKLSAYNEKRDFNRTAEPEGEPGEPAGRLRFLVQHHLARRDHYDLRLEWDGVLLSWAVPKGPSYNPHDKRLAVHVEDHPLEYRNFEGTIPQGEYGGGTVMLWDEGFWEPLGDVDAGLRDGELKFVLDGRRLKGAWVLVRLKPKPGEHGDNWLLIKEKDEHVQAEPGIAGYDTSVRTGRTMDEIASGDDGRLARNPFERADVELAKLVASAPKGDGWLYEVKYDGYRMLAFVEENRARLVSRNGKDYTGHFPAIADELADWSAGRAFVLDGEVAMIDADGRTDFQALQNFLRNPDGPQPAYLVFDLLALEGADLRDRPLLERKEVLEQLLEGAPASIRYSSHVRGRGEDSLRAACELRLEGVVGKRADAPYRGVRNGDWIKLKCDHRQEFVVGGYTRSEKNRTGVSSLLLGAYDGGGLCYVGRVGSGLGAAEARELEEAFEGLQRADAPFENPPKPRPHEQAAWLEPKLVAEVRFAEWTQDGLLRHPSYLGLRADKDPRAVRREEPDEDGPADDDAGPSPATAAADGVEPAAARQQAASPQAAASPSAWPSSDPHSPDRLERPMVTASRKSGLVIDGVTVTNPDKVMFGESGITKEQMVRYYAQVAERMLPYVGGRVLSIVRCPRGVGSACFFKKHPGPGSSGIVTIDVPASDGGTEEYFYLESAAGLVSEAQMDTMEFHVWGSRVDELEHPDTMVFDLDPDKGLDLEQVRRGVRDLKGLLDELSLTSFLKTSGGKGYHVVVPFEPASSWDAFRQFARRMAQVMAEKWPDRYTSNVRLAKRNGKIFIDWMRNGRGATSVAPYSLRARPGAPVSAPLAWDELDTVAPDAIHLEAALARAAAPDPWKGYFEVDQGLG